MKIDTRLTEVGRDPHNNHGVVNPPVYHATTILYPTLDALNAPRTGRGPYYGRYGTPTHFALEDGISELEGGHGTVLSGSGAAAITGTMLALLEPGDHILVEDNVYMPTRMCAQGILKRFGIKTSYFDPKIGAGIEELITPNTKLVYLESPGSLTFEVADLPAIAKAAKAKGLTVVADNTWGTGLLYPVLDLGADISIQAITKYVGGHSDVMMGAVTCNQATFDKVSTGFKQLGSSVGPDDVFLALRGLRTLRARLNHHERNAMIMANWLNSRPEVGKVMYPALKGDPSHALWQRDFKGACGLFGFTLKCPSQQALAALLDNLQLYGMGYSWGGYESLLIPCDPRPIRTASPYTDQAQVMRIHVGLEDTDDLIADLEAGFKRMTETG